MPIALVFVLWFFLTLALWGVFSWVHAGYLCKWREVSREQIALFPDADYFYTDPRNASVHFKAQNRMFGLLLKPQPEREVEKRRVQAMWLCIAAYANLLSFFCALMYFWTGHSL